MIRKRLFRILCTAMLLFIAGVLYSIFFQCTGIGLICPVRFMTGWKCPGCGVTHMCTALLHLDLAAAFFANPALLLLSPLLAVIFIPYCVNYIQTGCWRMRPWQNTVLWICIAILVLYGSARNIFSLP